MPCWTQFGTARLIHTVIYFELCHALPGLEGSVNEGARFHYSVHESSAYTPGSVVYVHEFCLTAVLRELMTAGELKGTLRGRLENATFIPDVYSVMQNKWIESFFTSNGYLGKLHILCIYVTVTHMVCFC